MRKETAIRARMREGGLRDGFIAGIKTAAEFIRGFDRQVSHPYRLSDCLLMKFNLIGKRHPAKNRGFIEGPRMVCVHHSYQGLTKAERLGTVVHIHLACGCEYTWGSKRQFWSLVRKGKWPWQKRK